MAFDIQFEQERIEAEFRTTLSSIARGHIRPEAIKKTLLELSALSHLLFRLLQEMEEWTLTRNKAVQVHLPERKQAQEDALARILTEMLDLQDYSPWAANKIEALASPSFVGPEAFL